MDTASAADYRLRLGFWFLLTTQLSVVVYGHLRVFVPGGDQGLAHPHRRPLVFGLPFGFCPLCLWPLHDPFTSLNATFIAMVARFAILPFKGCPAGGDCDTTPD